MALRGKSLRIVLTGILVFIAIVPPVGTEQVRIVDDTMVPSHIRIDNTLTDNELFDDAEKVVKAFMQRWDLKGASVAVARNGKLLYSRGLGYASTEDSLRAEPYNRFRIASISKLVTAIAIMKLQEDGRLSVNDLVFGPEGISIACEGSSCVW